MAREETTAWTIVDHACRHCGGRVLQRGDVYRCGTCGVESRSAPNGICGCGILPGLRPRPTGAIAQKPAQGPYRCVRNPSPSVHNPAEIVIMFGADEAPASERAS